MIRYEIYSNVASSDQGLQGQPALQELADSLRAQDVEARVVRVVQREEEAINLASSQFARGVNVRGTSVKTIPPEASLKGLLAWMRTVSARVDRGLHLHLDNVRQTNGAAILIAHVLAAGQQGFVSGLDGAGWARLTAAPDLTGQVVPKGLESNPQAKGEYLTRRTRPSGFWPMLHAVAELGILAAPVQARCAALAKSRDPQELAALPDPLVINLGLVSDSLERVNRLVEQFADLISTAEVSGELPLLFELITRDVPFPALLKRLLPLTLEAKRAGITSKRILINDVRIGLSNGQGSKDQLRALLLPLVVQARALHDPAAYLAATRLAPKDADALAALANVRKLFLELKGAAKEQAPGEQRPESEPGQMQVPLAIKQRLFELVVNLIYLAQFTQTFRDGNPPPAVKEIRDLLSSLVFDVFNVAQLRALKPTVPAKGVARNLAEKVPLAWSELQANLESLEEGLYPYAAVSAALAQRIAGKFKNAREQERVDQLNEYLRGSVHLLRLSTYMVGQVGLNPASWQALLEAGRSLGLTVYGARDEVRRGVGSSAAVPEGEIALQGTVLLMQREDSRLFPLRARPELIMLAYRYLLRTQVAVETRAFLSHKLNYLVNRYHAGLFEVLYQHLTWDSLLKLSRRQLWEILTQSKVLDAERLKELGYQAAEDARSTEGENPWLASPQARPDAAAPATALQGDALEHGYRDAYNRFLELQQRFTATKAPPATGGPVSLRTALSELFGSGEVFSPHDPAVRKRLAGTLEAEALAQAFVVFLGKNASLLGGQEPEEAFELILPGRLATLTLLKDRFTVTVGENARLIRLVPAAGRPDTGAGLAELDPTTRAVAEFFAPLVGGGASSLPDAEPHLRQLAPSLPVLSAYRAAWAGLLHVSSVAFIDQALRETVLRLITPAPPAAKDLVKLPEEQVLCLGASSFNQAKFHRVVARVDRKDAFLTLSEMAGWLARLQRLREEFRYFRDLIGDIHAIIRSLNLSVFEAAYVMNFGRALQLLDDALLVRAEEMRAPDLQRIQERARAVSLMLREIYDQESALRMRDRWLNRIITELKRQRSNVRINFVDALWEASAGATKDSAAKEGAAKDGAARSGAKPDAAATGGPGMGASPPDKADAEPARDAREAEFQTFSERVRQCIEFRQRMGQKRVVILSPANTQKALTLNLIDQLFRLKGLYLTVMVDTSSADSFSWDLLSRVPPHRLFDLGAL